jgi:hypothetical protein
MAIGGTLKRIFRGGPKGVARRARRAPRGSVPTRASKIYGSAEGVAGGAYVHLDDLVLSKPGPIQQFNRMGSFIGGAFMPAVKAGAAFGVSSGLGEIADQTDSSLIGAVAQLGSFWAGTLGFRQALRAPLRGARAKWGHRKDALGGSVRSLSRIYDRHMYAPERLVGRALKGGMKGFGRAMIGKGKGPFASSVPLPFRPVHGMAGIGKAFVLGSVDRLRYAGRVMRHGSRAHKLPGITGRMMGVRHPFWGAMGVGMLYGGARSIQRYESGQVGHTRYAPAPTGGINPRNWQGGITMLNARGGVQHRMGSDQMAMRMARGRRR